MGDYEEGFQLLEDKFGKGRDNVVALATMVRDRSTGGWPRPIVRGVTTNARSNKMLQIAQNPEVSLSSLSEMFTASGIGENRGWVLAPQNADLRKQLRTAFASWYDRANNEEDENCCILAIRLQKGTLNINHWEKLYHMDFVQRVIMDNGGIF